MKDHSKSHDMFNTYYTSNHPKRIHIRKDSEIISVINVPQGFNIMVQANKEQNASHLMKTALNIFHGNLFISIKRLSPGQEGPCRDLMSDAPFELKLKNSVVEIEKID